MVQILRRDHTGPLPIEANATGLNGFSEGAWQVSVHGADQRLTWLWVYLAIDADAR